MSDVFMSSVVVSNSSWRSLPSPALVAEAAESATASRQPSPFDPLMGRFSSNIPALDHVLGGGFVPGSVILLRGVALAGKSMLATELAQRSDRSSILYASTSESIGTMFRRFDKLGGRHSRVHLVTDPRVDQILSWAEVFHAKLVVLDGLMRDSPFSFAEVVTFARERGAVVVLAQTIAGEMDWDPHSDWARRSDVVIDVLDGFVRQLAVNKNRYGGCDKTAKFFICEGVCKWISDPSDPSLEMPIQRSPAPMSAFVDLDDVDGIAPEVCHVRWRVNAEALERGDELPFALTPAQMAAARRHQDFFSLPHSMVLRLRVKESAERDRLQVLVDREFESWE